MIGEAAMAKLIRYHWPGNIRELENVLERAVNLVDGPAILSHHIQVQEAGPSIAAPKHQSTQLRLGDSVAEAEREALLQAVQHHRSSRRLGEALGLSHTAVLKKLKKYGIIFPAK